MECKSNVFFSTEIKLSSNLDFYNSNQFSVAVNTDNLELHEEVIKYDIGTVQNPCDSNKNVSAKAVLKRVTISGEIYYKVSLDTFISSYNFMVDSSLISVKNSGWVSEESSIKLKQVDENGITQPYIIIEYISDIDKIITRNDINVILTNIEVKEIVSASNNAKLVLVEGEFEVLI